MMNGRVDPIPAHPEKRSMRVMASAVVLMVIAAFVGTPAGASPPDLAASSLSSVLPRQFTVPPIAAPRTALASPQLPRTTTVASVGPARDYNAALPIADSAAAGGARGGATPLAARLAGASYTVTSPRDDSDFQTNGVCASAPETGSICTLRAALEEANATPGEDTIYVAVKTISPISALPLVTAPIVLDGRGTAELSGSAAGPGVVGLWVVGGGSTITGLTINRWSTAGVYFTGRGGNRLIHSQVGTTPGGSAAAANGSGLNTSAGVMISDSPNNIVGSSTGSEGNIISGNNGPGVVVIGAAATGNRVSGNTIGLDRNGFSILPNVGGGIGIGRRGTVAGTAASATTIGGPALADANLISGNGDNGVTIEWASGTKVLRNVIGLTSDGRSAGNRGEGVSVYEAPNSIIGAAGQGNVLSGNQSTGVIAGGAATTHLKIQGNTVGTDPAGLVARPNTDGIVVTTDVIAHLAPPGVSIGGSLPGVGNLVSGNTGRGVAIYSAATITVAGNTVGLDRTGEKTLGNGETGIALVHTIKAKVGGAGPTSGNVVSGNRFGVGLTGPLSESNILAGNIIGATRNGAVAGNSYDGIDIYDSKNNTVGFAIGKTPTQTCSASCNVIANNGQDGMVIYGAAATGNTLRGNSIRRNAGPGIAFGDAGNQDTVLGVLANDDTDADTGPNDRLNFPVGVLAVDQVRNPGLASTTYTPGIRVVTGYTYPRKADLHIDVYALTSEDDADPWAAKAVIGYGEGRRWIGEADSDQDGLFKVALSASDAANYHRFTATATDKTTHSTSTFSAVCRPVAGPDADNDGDGLCDEWEGSGLDVDGDGIIDVDLAARGAQIGHKDLFLELDQFSDQAAQAHALNDVVFAFSKLSVVNPDKVKGINLHAYPALPPVASTLIPAVDESFVPDPAARKLDYAGLDRIMNGNPAVPCDGHFGTAEDRKDVKRCAAILAARHLVYRYGLFADQLAAKPDSSGVAGEMPGPYFVVALGSWVRSAANPHAANIPESLSIGGGWPTYCHDAASCLSQVQAGTIMHELGHSLGLLHGGQTSEWFKPNYLSVMNYLFQTRSASIDRPLTYSNTILPDLDETNLNEQIPIANGIDKNSLFPWSESAFMGVPKGQTVCEPIPTGLGAKPDWNTDGTPGNSTKVTLLLHSKNNKCNAAGIATLKGWRDLPAIALSDRLTALNMGWGTAGQTDIGELDDRTMTQGWAATRDSDHDGRVDNVDNCPMAANPTQADSNSDSIADACVPLIGWRDLQLRYAASKASAAAGQTFTATVTVTNNSPSAATGITVHATAPIDRAGSWNATNSTPTTGTYSASTRNWTIPTLLARGNAKLTFTVTAGTGTPATGTAEVTSSGQRDDDSTPGNHDTAEDDQQTVTILGPLPPGAHRYQQSILTIGVDTTGVAVSANGTTVGTAPFGGWPRRAVSWSTTGKMKSLGALGGHVSTATAVSRNGTAAGSSTNAAGQWRIVTYSNGTVKDLGPVCSFTCGNWQVTGVNDDGTVVGYESPPDASYVRAFKITANGVRNQLQGSAGLSGSQWAEAIADDGTVVGAAYGCLNAGPNCGNQPVQWNIWSDYPEKLGTLGGSDGSASAINPAGVTAGISRLPYPPGGILQPLHVFTRTAGTFLDLGALAGGGQQNVSATAINVGGTVVGGSDSQDGQHAFVSAAGKVIDLNSLLTAPSPWTMSTALGITDSGQIVTAAASADGRGALILLTPR